MKRLTKKAYNQEFELVRDIFKWVYYGKNHKPSDSRIQDIINSNPDCVYTGKLYRALNISTKFSKNKLPKYCIEKEFIYTSDYKDLLMSEIENKENFVSFSQDINGAISFAKEQINEGFFFNRYVIIQSFANGLNIPLLYEKYKDEIIQFWEEDAVTMNDRIYNEQEVLSQFDKATIGIIKTNDLDLSNDDAEIDINKIISTSWKDK